MPTSAQQRRLEIWNDRLTPAERDYDRFIAGQIPQGASWAPETGWGITEGRARLEAMISDECGGCACHRKPPCFHCENNHRNHETDDHQPVEPYELEAAELEAYEEHEARARATRWAAHAADGT